MNCDDVRNGVYVFLDGEFAAPEAEEFRRHLDACGDCRAFAEHEARFLEHVREELDAPEVPDGLRQRLEERLREAPGPEPVAPQRVEGAWLTGTRRGRVLLTAVPTAAACVALLLYVSGWGGRVGSGDEVTRAAVGGHTLPPEVEGDQQHVRRWVRDKVPFRPVPPLRKGEEVRLRGVRLMQLHGHPAVLFCYEVHGRRVSALQVPASEVRGQPPATVVRHRIDGYPVLRFRRDGVLNTVVGDLPEQLLVQATPTHASP